MTGTGEEVQEVEVLVVGAGFGGLGAAIRMRERGHRDFVVIERNADVGGTWLANTYPGAQCDVPSNLYSYSFAPNPEWTHSYPEQPQIQRYLRDCAERFGVLGHVRFGTEVLEARWRPEDGRWHVRTSGGDYAPRVLIAASGLLSEPTTPKLPGLDDFEGAVFHTGRWDHEHDLRGERVALIGTGATAIQVGPRIGPLASRLHVFQRTPGWVLPHPDREIHAGLRRLYARAPLVQRVARQVVYGLREVLGGEMTRSPGLLRVQELVCRAWIRVNVRDPELRRKVTPEYRFGCKRALLSNDWYPTLTAPNAELVTDPIAEIRARSIVTADGTERPLDAIVLATGFRPTDPAIAHRVRDGQGRTLAEHWAVSPSAYLGTAVAGFPNLFLLYGPNVNLGHSSIVYMLEAQIHYVLQALDLLASGEAAALEVRPEVQAAYNEELAERLPRTIWNTGGCSSWYLDETGRNSTMWPDFTFRYRRRVDRLERSEYALT